MVNVLIATPVHGGMVTTYYMNSMFRLNEALRARGGFRGRRYFLASSMVARSRNAYATALLEDPALTHLLFIDSDMGFNPTAVTRLLDLDKPFAGCICPYRTMDYDRFHAIARQIDDPKLARSVAQNYVAAERLLESPGVEGVYRGFARTERLGMALTLLKREVLERLSEAHPELWAPVDRGYQGLELRDRVFQAFEGYRAETGIVLSEDMSFSRRWTELGGEIWACVDEEITHVGPTPFTGAYGARMQFETGGPGVAGAGSNSDVGDQ
jgi:hypothetical protein